MQHPDEGTIHAWLDGALSADEARAFEAHVAECADCAAAVSEARGLLAASSRILSALDSVPGGVLPASDPEIAADARVVPIGRSSLWRSTGWRAAAAIVLVGSVSWLATRTVGKQAEDNIASQTELSSVGAIGPTTPASTRMQADSVPKVGEQSAPPSAARTAQSPARRDARVNVEPSSGSATAANATKPAVPPAPAPQVAAAPRVMPYAMPRLTELPNAGAVGGAGSGAGGKATVIAQSAAPTAQSAPPAADASAMLREERRVADEGLGARIAAKAAPRMKASAPGAASGALSRMDAPAMLDAEVERLAGCYHIENAASQSSLPGVRAAAELLPARVELLTGRDPSAGGSWRILRPAPGAPPLRLAARAAWMPVTADSVKFELGEGTQSVTARIAVKGDSLHGLATVNDPTLPGGTMGTGMRGSRLPCTTP